MNTNFYQDKDFSYTEMGIVLEDFNCYYSKGKIYIPVLMPELSSSAPYRTTSKKPNTSNIVNYSSKHAVSSITRTNYIELKVPRYIGAELEPIGSNIVYKGQRVLITFVGGEVNNPKVIGVY